MKIKSTKLILNPKEESDIDRVSSECDDHNLRCSRYFRHINAWYAYREYGQFEQPLPGRTEPQRPGEKARRHPVPVAALQLELLLQPRTDRAPSRAASLYRASIPMRTRPESLNLDASMLNFEPASRVSSFRRETKTAQTLSIVMGGFILCWLPFFIFYLLTPFIKSNDVNLLIMQYLTWLGWINSAINPFIYAFYSADFRIAFWRLTVKHFSKSRRADFASQHK
ncbi:hypothetical protein NQ318_009437 [Aromia moschata]|uniref:G-protein coupled receptors family 1 profile domain-containing protein n=1 Tax=Aromia moschata TaxID=1265417 RepID=A0AAV8Z8S4_9CUCU|nr:hypothetical protein NQ318_009437 [Aromia moschata]